MEVKQIYDILNSVTTEVIGDSALLKEDLSNIVDIGKALENIDDDNKYKNFLTGLVDRIGKTIFVDRKYAGRAPSVLMDAWEFGSILQKVRGELPDATENESWELEDGASYDENIYTGLKVHAKFFNKRVCWEIPLSITDEQLKSAFISAGEMNGFLGMIYNEVDKVLVVHMDALIMRLINNMIGETIYADYQGGTLSAKTGVKAINLLKMYNDQYGTSLTKAQAYVTPAFIRFACWVIGYTSDNISQMSTLFNVGGTQKFTPKEYQRLVMLSRFARGANVFLQSETFHEEFTRLPSADVVPFWQGSGQTYAIGDVSKIKITTASGHDVELDGVLAVMFDRDALGVSNLKRNVPAKYNAKGEFTNLWYKQFAGHFNDLDENFVVFFIA